MKVIKSLNNNMVLLEDKNGQTRIGQGKGIGFQKRPGDYIDPALIERSFILETEDERTRFQNLFLEIPDIFWKMAEDIVIYGRNRYSLVVSDKVILPLCDHLAGSVKRYQNGIALTNPMLWDIKRIYPKEYKTGLYALQLVKEHFQLEMKEDEAAFLAYHFVCAQLGESRSNASPNNMTSLIGIIIDEVQQTFNITMNEEDWNYQNFLAYLKFLANRILEGDPYQGNEDQELYYELILLYPKVYDCVEKIASFIKDGFNYEICQEDRMDMMIYIERLTKYYSRTRK
jgi:beta-glucoside operon transcriptional antiterminator